MQCWYCKKEIQDESAWICPHCKCPLYDSKGKPIESLKKYVSQTNRRIAIIAVIGCIAVSLPIVLPFLL